jgi:hypothetical protein
VIERMVGMYAVFRDQCEENALERVLIASLPSAACDELPMRASAGVPAPLQELQTVGR